jgi:ABC-2 type transport system permease protein
MTAVTDPHPPARSELRAAVRRTLGLTAANARLLVRNRLTLAYGLILPLLPLAFLFAAERGDVTSGAAVISSALMLAFLFPVYYNLLSVIVTRRDELVLKRLRTGETRDGELLGSMALPGLLIALVVSIATVGIGAAFGLPLPVNPVLYLVMVLAGGVLFAAFAIWTAAWTRNAEAAQLTSMPVIVLALLGTLRGAFPEGLRPVIDLTPGAALDALLRISWFGQTADGSVGFAASWGAAVQPLLVVAFWTAVAAELARRSMRWEPRA